ncbi:hypothetical protein PR048_004665 [Dryococelus australis]|uniref:Uncharacterized protein n=1 Tax=Dryococelus australis TaxID=614101 RepID=A0ABQ9I6F0_9NEOP|nr:hypothetical protein PR048_004665 [Dryococelus australis]
MTPPLQFANHDKRSKLRSHVLWCQGSFAVTVKSFAVAIILSFRKVCPEVGIASMQCSGVNANRDKVTLALLPLPRTEPSVTTEGAARMRVKNGSTLPLTYLGQLTFC